MNHDLNNDQTILKNRFSVWLYLPFFLMAILVGVVWVKYDKTPLQFDQLSAGTLQSSSLTQRDIVLYFPLLAGEGWSTEQRTISGFESEHNEIQKALEELIKGPQREGRSVFPDTARIEGVYQDKQNNLFCDFVFEEESVNLGGINSEWAAIQSIIQTIQSNFDDIQTVQLLINHKENETFAGHIDISRPFRLIRVKEEIP